MEKLTLVQIRAKFESTVHSFSYTVFFWANNGQKTKVKVKRNECTAKQSILDCILLQKKHLLLLICRRIQNFIIIIDQNK